MIESDLHNAIEWRDEDRLRDLLGEGYAPDADGLRPITPLMRAAQLGLDSFVAILIDAGASVDKRAKSSRETALLFAAGADKTSTCRLLLDHGAAPNVFNEGGTTALIEASRNQNIELVELLLDKGANPNGSGKCIETPLTAAAGSQDPRIVQRLLLAGADPNLRSAGDTFALIYATSPQAAAMLIQHGANVNARTPEGKNALMHLIHVGSIELFRVHLAAGVDVNAADKFGRTLFNNAGRSSSLGIG